MRYKVIKSSKEAKICLFICDETTRRFNEIIREVSRKDDGSLKIEEILLTSSKARLEFSEKYYDDIEDKNEYEYLSAISDDFKNGTSEAGQKFLNTVIKTLFDKEFPPLAPSSSEIKSPSTPAPTSTAGTSSSSSSTSANQNPRPQSTIIHDMDDQKFEQLLEDEKKKVEKESEPAASPAAPTDTSASSSLVTNTTAESSRSESESKKPIWQQELEKEKTTTSTPSSSEVPSSSTASKLEGEIDPIEIIDALLNQMDDLKAHSEDKRSGDNTIKSGEAVENEEVNKFIRFYMSIALTYNSGYLQQPSNGDITRAFEIDFGTRKALEHNLNDYPFWLMKSLDVLEDLPQGVIPPENTITMPALINVVNELERRLASYQRTPKEECVVLNVNGHPDSAFRDKVINNLSSTDEEIRKSQVRELANNVKANAVYVLEGSKAFYFNKKENLYKSFVDKHNAKNITSILPLPDYESRPLSPEALIQIYSILSHHHMDEIDKIRDSFYEFKNTILPFLKARELLQIATSEIFDSNLDAFLKKIEALKNNPVALGKLKNSLEEGNADLMWLKNIRKEEKVQKKKPHSNSLASTSSSSIGRGSSEDETFYAFYQVKGKPFCYLETKEANISKVYKIYMLTGVVQIEDVNEVVNLGERVVKAVLNVNKNAFFSSSGARYDFIKPHELDSLMNQKNPSKSDEVAHVLSKCLLYANLMEVTERGITRWEKPDVQPPKKTEAEKKVVYAIYKGEDKKSCYLVSREINPPSEKVYEVSYENGVASVKDVTATVNLKNKESSKEIFENDSKYIIPSEFNSSVSKEDHSKNKAINRLLSMALDATGVIAIHNDEEVTEWQKTETKSPSTPAPTSTTGVLSQPLTPSSTSHISSIDESNTIELSAPSSSSSSSSGNTGSSSSSSSSETKPSPAKDTATQSPSTPAPTSTAGASSSENTTTSTEAPPQPQTLDDGYYAYKEGENNYLVTKENDLVYVYKISEESKIDYIKNQDEIKKVLNAKDQLNKFEVTHAASGGVGFIEYDDIQPKAFYDAIVLKKGLNESSIGGIRSVVNKALNTMGMVGADSDPFEEINGFAYFIYQDAYGTYIYFPNEEGKWRPVLEISADKVSLLGKEVNLKEASDSRENVARALNHIFKAKGHEISSLKGLIEAVNNDVKKSKNISRLQDNNQRNFCIDVLDSAGIKHELEKKEIQKNESASPKTNVEPTSTSSSSVPTDTSAPPSSTTTTTEMNNPPVAPISGEEIISNMTDEEFAVLMQNNQPLETNVSEKFYVSYVEGNNFCNLVVLKETDSADKSSYKQEEIKRYFVDRSGSVKEVRVSNFNANDEEILLDLTAQVSPTVFHKTVIDRQSPENIGAALAVVNEVLTGYKLIAEELTQNDFMVANQLHVVTSGGKKVKKSEIKISDEGANDSVSGPTYKKEEVKIGSRGRRNTITLSTEQVELINVNVDGIEPVEGLPDGFYVFKEEVETNVEGQMAIDSCLVTIETKDNKKIIKYYLVFKDGTVNCWKQSNTETSSEVNISNLDMKKYEYREKLEVGLSATHFFEMFGNRDEEEKLEISSLKVPATKVVNDVLEKTGAAGANSLTWPNIQESNINLKYNTKDSSVAQSPKLSSEDQEALDEIDEALDGVGPPTRSSTPPSSNSSFSSSSSGSGGSSSDLKGIGEQPQPSSFGKSSPQGQTQPFQSSSDLTTKASTEEFFMSNMVGEDFCTLIVMKVTPSGKDEKEVTIEEKKRYMVFNTGKVIETNIVETLDKNEKPQPLKTLLSPTNFHKVIFDKDGIEKNKDAIPAVVSLVNEALLTSDLIAKKLTRDDFAAANGLKGVPISQKKKIGDGEDKKPKTSPNVPTSTSGPQASTTTSTTKGEEEKKEIDLETLSDEAFDLVLQDAKNKLEEEDEIVEIEEEINYDEIPKLSPEGETLLADIESGDFTQPSFPVSYLAYKIHGKGQKFCVMEVLDPKGGQSVFLRLDPNGDIRRFRAENPSDVGDLKVVEKSDAERIEDKQIDRDEFLRCIPLNSGNNKLYIIHEGDKAIYEIAVGAIRTAKVKNIFVEEYRGDVGKTIKKATVTPSVTHDDTKIPERKSTSRGNRKISERPNEAPPRVPHFKYEIIESNNSGDLFLRLEKNPENAADDEWYRIKENGLENAGSAAPRDETSRTTLHSGEVENIPFARFTPLFQKFNLITNTRSSAGDITPTAVEKTFLHELFTSISQVAQSKNLDRIKSFADEKVKQFKPAPKDLPILPDIEPDSTFTVYLGENNGAKNKNSFCYLELYQLGSTLDIPATLGYYKIYQDGRIEEVSAPKNLQNFMGKWVDEGFQKQSYVKGTKDYPRKNLGLGVSPGELNDQIKSNVNKEVPTRMGGDGETTSMFELVKHALALDDITLKQDLEKLTITSSIREKKKGFFDGIVDGFNVIKEGIKKISTPKQAAGGPTSDEQKGGEDKKEKEKSNEKEKEKTPQKDQDDDSDSDEDKDSGSDTEPESEEEEISLSTLPSYAVYKGDGKKFCYMVAAQPAEKPEEAVKRTYKITFEGRTAQIKDVTDTVNLLSENRLLAKYVKGISHYYKVSINGDISVKSDDYIPNPFSPAEFRDRVNSTNNKVTLEVSVNSRFFNAPEKALKVAGILNEKKRLTNIVKVDESKMQEVSEDPGPRNKVRESLDLRKKLNADGTMEFGDETIENPESEEDGEEQEDTLGNGSDQDDSDSDEEIDGSQRPKAKKGKDSTESESDESETDENETDEEPESAVGLSLLDKPTSPISDDEQNKILKQFSKMGDYIAFLGLIDGAASYADERDAWKKFHKQLWEQYDDAELISSEEEYADDFTANRLGVDQSRIKKYSKVKEGFLNALHEMPFIKDYAEEMLEEKVYLEEHADSPELMSTEERMTDEIRKGWNNLVDLAPRKNIYASEIESILGSKISRKLPLNATDLERLDFLTNLWADDKATKLGDDAFHHGKLSKNIAALQNRINFAQVKYKQEKIKDKTPVRGFYVMESDWDKNVRDLKGVPAYVYVKEKEGSVYLVTNNYFEPAKLGFKNEKDWFQFLEIFEDPNDEDWELKDVESLDEEQSEALESMFEPAGLREVVLRPAGAMVPDIDAMGKGDKEEIEDVLDSMAQILAFLKAQQPAPDSEAGIKLQAYKNIFLKVLEAYGHEFEYPDNPTADFYLSDFHESGLLFTEYADNIEMLQQMFEMSLGQLPELDLADHVSEIVTREIDRLNDRFVDADFDTEIHTKIQNLMPHVIQEKPGSFKHVHASAIEKILNTIGAQAVVYKEQLEALEANVNCVLELEAELPKNYVKELKRLLSYAQFALWRNETQSGPDRQPINLSGNFKPVNLLDGAAAINLPADRNQTLTNLSIMATDIARLEGTIYQTERNALINMYTVSLAEYAGPMELDPADYEDEAYSLLFRQDANFTAADFAKAGINLGHEKSIDKVEKSTLSAFKALPYNRATDYAEFIWNQAIAVESGRVLSTRDEVSVETSNMWRWVLRGQESEGVDADNTYIREIGNILLRRQTAVPPQTLTRADLDNIQKLILASGDQQEIRSPRLKQFQTYIRYARERYQQENIVPVPAALGFDFIGSPLWVPPNPPLPAGNNNAYVFVPTIGGAGELYFIDRTQPTHRVNGPTQLTAAEVNQFVAGQPTLNIARTARDLMPQELDVLKPLFLSKIILTPQVFALNAAELTRVLVHMAECIALVNTWKPQDGLAGANEANLRLNIYKNFFLKALEIAHAQINFVNPVPGSSEELLVQLIAQKPTANFDAADFVDATTGQSRLRYASEDYSPENIQNIFLRAMRHLGQPQLNGNYVAQALKRERARLEGRISDDLMQEIQAGVNAIPFAIPAGNNNAHVHAIDKARQEIAVAPTHKALVDIRDNAQEVLRHGGISTAFADSLTELVNYTDFMLARYPAARKAQEDQVVIAQRAAQISRLKQVAMHRAFLPQNDEESRKIIEQLYEMAQCIARLAVDPSPQAQAICRALIAVYKHVWNSYDFGQRLPARAEYAHGNPREILYIKDPEGDFTPADFARFQVDLKDIKTAAENQTTFVDALKKVPYVANYVDEVVNQVVVAETRALINPLIAHTTPVEMADGIQAKWDDIAKPHETVLPAGYIAQLNNVYVKEIDNLIKTKLQAPNELSYSDLQTLQQLMHHWKANQQHQSQDKAFTKNMLALERFFEYAEQRYQRENLNVASAIEFFTQNQRPSAAVPMTLPVTNNSAYVYFMPPPPQVAAPEYYFVDKSGQVPIVTELRFLPGKDFPDIINVVGVPAPAVLGLPPGTRLLPPGAVLNANQIRDMKNILFPVIQSPANVYLNRQGFASGAFVNNEAQDAARALRKMIEDIVLLNTNITALHLKANKTPAENIKLAEMQSTRNACQAIFLKAVVAYGHKPFAVPANPDQAFVKQMLIKNPYATFKMEDLGDLRLSDPLKLRFDTQKLEDDFLSAMTTLPHLDLRQNALQILKREKIRAKAILNPVSPVEQAIAAGNDALEITEEIKSRWAALELRGYLAKNVHYLAVQKAMQDIINTGGNISLAALVQFESNLARLIVRANKETMTPAFMAALEELYGYTNYAIMRHSYFPAPAPAPQFAFAPRPLPLIALADAANLEDWQKLKIVDLLYEIAKCIARWADSIDPQIRQKRTAWIALYTQILGEYAPANLNFGNKAFLNLPNGNFISADFAAIGINLGEQEKFDKTERRVLTAISAIPGIKITPYIEHVIGHMLKAQQGSLPPVTGSVPPVPDTAKEISQGIWDVWFNVLNPPQEDDNHKIQKNNLYIKELDQFLRLRLTIPPARNLLNRYAKLSYQELITAQQLLTTWRSSRDFADRKLFKNPYFSQKMRELESYIKYGLARYEAQRAELMPAGLGAAAGIRTDFVKIHNVNEFNPEADCRYYVIVQPDENDESTAEFYFVDPTKVPATDKKLNFLPGKNIDDVKREIAGFNETQIKNGTRIPYDAVIHNVPELAVRKLKSVVAPSNVVLVKDGWTLNAAQFNDLRPEGIFSGFRKEASEAHKTASVLVDMAERIAISRAQMWVRGPRDAENEQALKAWENIFYQVVESLRVPGGIPFVATPPNRLSEDQGLVNDLIANRPYADFTIADFGTRKLKHLQHTFDAQKLREGFKNDLGKLSQFGLAPYVDHILQAEIKKTSLTYQAIPEPEEITKGILARWDIMVDAKPDEPANKWQSISKWEKFDSAAGTYKENVHLWQIWKTVEDLKNDPNRNITLRELIKLAEAIEKFIAAMFLKPPFFDKLKKLESYVKYAIMRYSHLDTDITFSGKMMPEKDVKKLLKAQHWEVHDYPNFPKRKILRALHEDVIFPGAGQVYYTVDKKNNVKGFYANFPNRMNINDERNMATIKKLVQAAIDGGLTNGPVDIELKEVYLKNDAFKRDIENLYKAEIAKLNKNAGYKKYEVEIKFNKPSSSSAGSGPTSSTSNTSKTTTTKKTAKPNKTSAPSKKTGKKTDEAPPKKVENESSGEEMSEKKKPRRLG